MPPRLPLSRLPTLSPPPPRCALPFLSLPFAIPPILSASPRSRNGQSRPAAVKSPADWARRQNRDPYVREARANDFRSRSAFKLLQIQRAHKLLKGGMSVLDLGASPGGWAQVAGMLVSGGRGRKEGVVVAVDLVPLRPVWEPPGVVFVQGDITHEQTLEQVQEILRDRGRGLKVDAVISDMAPHSIGVEVSDRTRQMELCYAALGVARRMLKIGGTFICKVFVGGEENAFRHVLLDYFYSVRIVRPPATRKTSSEVYFVCAGSFMGDEVGDEDAGTGLGMGSARNRNRSDEGGAEVESAESEVGANPADGGGDAGAPARDESPAGRP
ncbi:FtsJ-like methyltransferase-domain-containing protein [Hyaloraphidium curvatum]|nr:FtsJ-like methyltransferase-domain-containing protein [Hyaloraphidium curvatum]